MKSARKFVVKTVWARKHLMVQEANQCELVSHCTGAGSIHPFGNTGQGAIICGKGKLGPSVPIAKASAPHVKRGTSVKALQSRIICLKPYDLILARMKGPERGLEVRKYDDVQFSMMSRD